MHYGRYRGANRWHSRFASRSRSLDFGLVNVTACWSRLFLYCYLITMTSMSICATRSRLESFRLCLAMLNADATLGTTGGALLSLRLAGFSSNATHATYATQRTQLTERTQRPLLPMQLRFGRCVSCICCVTFLRSLRTLRALR